MALFGRKTEEKKESAPAQAPAAQKNVAAGSSTDVFSVLRNPRITEKASMHMSEGVYAFDVAEDATKRSVMQAVQAVYNVHPRKVAIVTIAKKTRRNARTGRYGRTTGGKKAYVYLKKGETITIS